MGTLFLRSYDYSPSIKILSERARIEYVTRFSEGVNPSVVKIAKLHTPRIYQMRYSFVDHSQPLHTSFIPVDVGTRYGHISVRDCVTLIINPKNPWTMTSVLERVKI